ncbi:MAG: DUF1207 domain-containing protein [Ignavibacteriae bacterium HGW-Ignavibacteriae-3]|nr:MAG: DUF1207 domain-containing protein [Ignavibacteriae bacterium HGW-Ignavibacteriae-3]
MKKYLVITFFVLSPFLLNAQTPAETEIILFPSDLTVHPFAANQLEPKLGFDFKTIGNELWLNIGNSMDLIRIKNDGQYFSFGADLFTWTLLKREDNFHFPVDAVDYMFGVNMAYITRIHDYSFGGRVRISHISAHFVDGHYDGSKKQWKDGLDPRVYSREFIELLGFYSFYNLRIFVGGTYLFHVDPSTIGRGMLQTGFEYYMKDALAYNLSPFLAADGILKIKDNSRNFTFNLGVKFGEIDGRGLRLYYQYYNGYDINGEYYNFKREYSSIGFNLDL